MAQQVLIDHSGGATERSRWRTLAVFGHTLSCSARVVARAAVGRLSPDKVDAVVARWYGHVFRVSRTSLSADGMGQLAPGQSYLLLSNHTSLLDIPAVCASFPGSVRFVAKAELRRVPVFGRALAEAGILFVDRADRAQAIAALKGASSLVRDGTSLWIAAEGARSTGGRLGPFKKGPFHVALELGVPVVPTWVEGADAVIPTGSLASVSGRWVRVAYGAPIPTAGLGIDDLPALMAECREALEGLQRQVQT